MLFNSINFAVFLPIVFILYWFFTKNDFKKQNILLLIASYFFYACWDWKFLFLLMFSTFLDYFTGIKIHNAKQLSDKKKWLWISIVINVGFLIIFKYYNFFIESFSQSLNLLGMQTNFWTLQIILPVGISFYTFHGLSYILDIYNGKIKPEENIISYSLFVSFFPLLVAGPIERSTHLLPQIIKGRQFEYSKAVDGLKQILWGLFKKIVIADNCAEYANIIFNNSEAYSGSTLFLGAIFFTFQIYGDFSGYSDIAQGSAKLFGIDLLKNFSFPYFSRDIAEFWRRWHISLSTWFRDYLYIPLGGSKGSIITKIRNTYIIFLVSGFWHGANWTFIAWGLLNAIYITPSIIFNSNRTNLDIVAQKSIFPSIKEFVSMAITFILVVFAWIFFRATDLNHAISYISTIFSKSILSIPKFPRMTHSVTTIQFIIIFMIIEWFGRKNNHTLEKFGINWNRSLRWALYLITIIVIILFGGEQQEFIYFQF